MRRVARETIFKLVFEYTFQDEENEETLDLMLLDAELDESDKEFIKETYACVIENYDSFKETISKNITGYTIDRVYRSDLSVMLIALAELKKGEVPIPVICNEAVSLAKKYSTEKSGSFVNGVLAKIIKESNK